MKLKQAQVIADFIVGALQQHCELIQIGGSVRRECSYVGDIEIVCVPKNVDQKNLFDEFTTAVHASGFVEVANQLGTVIRGKLDTGKYCKISLKQLIDFDLFMTTREDYYRILAIRTGPADYSAKVLACGWKNRGWCGSDMGLRRIKDCISVTGADKKEKWRCMNPQGDLPPVWQSEEEFFAWVGAKFVHPSKRRV